MEGRWMLGALALVLVGAAALGNSPSVAAGVWAIAITWLGVGALFQARRRVG
jgi:hypothetical protein